MPTFAAAKVLGYETSLGAIATLFNSGNLVQLVWFLLIGLAAGWIAGRVMRGRSLGWVTNLLVGIVGAVLGGFLFRLVGLVATGILGNLVAATVGAILLLYVVQRLRL